MKKRVFAVLMAMAMLLSLLAACSGDDTADTRNPKDISNAADAGMPADETILSDISVDNSAIESAAEIANQYSAKDTDENYDESSATKVTLNGSTISVDGTGATVSGNVLIIHAGGVYIVSGTLSDGQILISADEKDDVRLVLNDANISCADGAPIYAAAADKLIITLAPDTSNTVTDGGSSFAYADAEAEEPDAAIFAKCDLSFNGSGSLTVSAGFKNGIGTKDDLVIVNGNYVINAKNDALRGRDSVTILDGSFTLTAGGDGIQSNNGEDSAKGWISLDGGSYDITAANDGIQAESILSISGGIYSIKTGGGASGNSSETQSNKGIKAATDMLLSGGTFTFDSADDSIHANNNIVISGGDFTIASGDDGVHADQDLSITGGTIHITKSYEGIEGATITISNGSINITSSDDAINAAGGDDEGSGGRRGRDQFSASENSYINISGGTISFVAGGDGIDSNGATNISGGTITALIYSSPDNGAIDCSGTLTITGGIVFYGGTGMGNTPQGNSTQSYLFVSGSLSQGTVITVKKDGETIASTNLTISCQYLAISTPNITNGQSYEIYSGSSLLSTATAGSGGISGGMGGGPGGGRKRP